MIQTEEQPWKGGVSRQAGESCDMASVVWAGIILWNIWEDFVSQSTRPFKRKRILGARESVPHSDSKRCPWNRSVGPRGEGWLRKQAGTAYTTQQAKPDPGISLKFPPAWWDGSSEFVCFKKIKTCRSLKSKNSLFLEYLLHMYCTASQSSCSWTTGTTTPVPAPGQPERREQHSAQHRGPHTPEEGRMSSQECATSGRARVKIPGTGSRIHAWSISRLIGSLSNAWVLINGRNYLLNGE